jgi:hypothetical protein
MDTDFVGNTRIIRREYIVIATASQCALLCTLVILDYIFNH